MASFADFLSELNDDLDRLRTAVTHLAHVDNVFYQVQAILQANSDFKDEAIFQDWMASCYVDSMVVGLRRLADSDRRTLSLYRVLEKMKPRAAEFTRKWYIDLHPASLHQNADIRFSNLVGGPHASLPVAVIEAKQTELSDSLQVVKDFADQFIAHSDTKPTACLLTFSDVRQALVSSFRVLQWLHSIIDSAGIRSPVPVIQSNWLRIFCVPWLKLDQDSPTYIHLDDLLNKGPSGTT